jgi:hypothetical protein
MILTVIANPLSARVLLLSALVALLAWPLAWALLAVAQGVGVSVGGGTFIGVAVPLGDCPWGVVNEPEVSYAGSSAALWGYWLAPSLMALVVAWLLPTVVPVPATWGWELLVFHLSTAAAVLGLGWAPGFGIGDGPIAGLRTFWNVPTRQSLLVSMSLGVLSAVPAVIRLGGHLWTVPGGPSRRRRALLAVLHGWTPFLLWLLVTVALGWPLSGASVLGAGLALLGCLLGALVFVPRAVVHPVRPVGMGALVLAAPLGILATVMLLWAGTPRAGRTLAVVWDRPALANNIRVEWRVFWLRQPPPAPREKSR